MRASSLMNLATTGPQLASNTLACVDPSAPNATKLASRTREDLKTVAPARTPRPLTTAPVPLCGNCSTTSGKMPTLSCQGAPASALAATLSACGSMPVKSRPEMLSRSPSLRTASMTPICRSWSCCSSNGIGAVALRARQVERNSVPPAMVCDGPAAVGNAREEAQATVCLRSGKRDRRAELQPATRDRQRLRCMPRHGPRR
jgi:hypothetical protein